MAINPYIKSETPPPPKSCYRLTLKNTGEAIEVNHEDLPDEEGVPGSILATLLGVGIELEHACGGISACSTCHVYVLEGADSAPEPSEEEEDMLDLAPGVRLESRLACQCVPDGSESVVIQIPDWSRNEVSEDPH